MMPIAESLELTTWLWRTWLYVSQGRVLAIIFGVGFALLAIFLLIASRTKWGQAKPLTKCVVLSILAHVWLLMYALGTREVLPQGSPDGEPGPMSIAFEDESAMPENATPPIPALESDFASLQPTSNPEDTSQQEDQELPEWERLTELEDLPVPDLLKTELAEELPPEAPEILPELEPEQLPDIPSDEQLAELLTPEPIVEPAPVEPPPESSVLPQSLQDQRPQPPFQTVANSAPSSNVPAANVPVASQPVAPAPRREADPNSTQQLTSAYQLRQASNRLQLTRSFGADADTEAAVKAALTWLANNQASSGGWIAADHGAGTETMALGQNRYNTGREADTGITGLALLAFLSAGHTHLSGEHRDTVAAGLSFLLDEQMPSGDLAGRKQLGQGRGILNARMYCHSIAMLALAEAYAMTNDSRLYQAVSKATNYSLKAQDPVGGGWRYIPGTPGDLSQFGWQAMALKSVSKSGIRLPQKTQTLMVKFLDSCSAGIHGGLARYMPNEGRPSTTMTSEAFACRLLLNLPMTAAARNEAIGMIMSERPGQEQDNIYYWYYATLAMFQLQDGNWREWNRALKQRLLTTQIPNYAEEAGSWNPDRIWGGYGGRVYSTAMSCMCLEVYYRYLPMLR